MKPILNVVILTLCFVSYSFGQIDLGYKAGMNISRVRHSAGNDYTSNLMYNTGVVTKFKLRKNNFLNIEYLLSIKGFKGLLIPSGTTTTSLSYISLPILFEHKPSNKFYLQIGPELNYLIAAKMNNGTINKSVADNYKKFDVSLVGGLGYNIAKQISLETRYIYGLSKINQSSGSIYSEYNRTFQINLIYWFK